MAFNVETFRTRALTAAIFVAVMAAGLLWNRWSFFLLFTIVHFGCWMEYMRLVKSFHKHYASISILHKTAVMLGGWCLMLFFTQHQLLIGNLSLTTAGLWLGVLCALVLPFTELASFKTGSVASMGYSLFGLLYISLPLALLVALRMHWADDRASLSYTLPLLTIFTIWINDTMAYIVGSFIGKTPLSSISPKKTWEGTVGGIILAVAIIILLAYLTQRISPLHAGIMALLAAVSGTFGDLFESRLKRMAGVKDSGRIMPGHGGFLDRFDSLLFASVSVWLYAMLVL